MEIIPSKEKEVKNDIAFSSSGLKIEGEPADNLCVKAYRLLKKKFPHIPPVQMHLHKVIPAGSGLGGGSSDASHTLKLLNEISGLRLSTKDLIEEASMLGSDCPFFIINKPCFSKGRGEMLEEIGLDLGNYKIILVNPGISISTREAFAGIKPFIPGISIREIIHKPMEVWKNELKNDFEKTIFPQYPAIEKIKNDLYHAGALYASMSGSGSSVYGIFTKGNSSSLNFPSHYFVKELNC